MLSKINKTECWVAFGLCLIFAIILKFSYASRLQDEKMKHYSSEKFLPVVATMHKYTEYEEVEYRDTDDDGTYTRYSRTKYNITYQYEVNGNIYYKIVNGEDSLVASLNLYYDPKNPQTTSFYATYEDAVDGFVVVKIIGDVFMILTVFVACFAVYRTFVYKTPDELGGVVVKDDFTSFDNGRSYDDDFNQEEILNDYGVVATDNFDYISTVKHSNTVIPNQGNKTNVGKVETIAFPGKIKTKEQFVLYTEDEYQDMINDK